MNTLKLSTGVCAIALLFASCQDGKKETAKKNVKQYENYVDSISNLDMAEAHSNWDKIENDFNSHKTMATENLDNITENQDLKKEVDKSTADFEAYKTKVTEDMDRKDMETSKNNLRTSLLGQSYVNDEMKFAWVNKDNILSVYQNFVDTVEANKDNYSREDWDEIKLLYEAIDTRKNTVEKEGLSSSDNMKIAGLKLKFAPTYTLNRIGAKSEENADAKK